MQEKKESRKRKKVGKERNECKLFSFPEIGYVGGKLREYYNKMD